ncbi:MAG: hypothetical protein LBC19_16140 [Tannerella sp.]|jgi:hypothetical protein|nr:hypothetical protein [Tannerella sp.]
MIRKALAFQKMAKVAVADNKVENAKKFMAGYYDCMKGIYDQNPNDEYIRQFKRMAQILESE